MGQMVKRRRTGTFESLGSTGGAMVGRYAGGAVGGPFGMAAGGIAGSYAGGYAGKAVDKKMATKLAFSNESTLSTRHAASKKGGNKLNKKNRKKTVKVSAALRAKIGKVIEEKKIHGSWTQISFGVINRPENCAQTVSAITQATNTDFQGGWQFLPEQLLHMASVLFNNKADSQGSRQMDDTGNLGVRSVGEYNPNGKLQAGNNARFHVKNSYEIYHMKNNTQQTLKVRVYTCSIKNVQGLIDTNAKVPDGTFVSNDQSDNQPISYWQSTLNDATGRNVGGADLFRIGMRPEKNPVWTKHWNYETTDVLLDPGQSYTCNIQGPKAQDCDLSKYYDRNNGFQTIQKYSRYTFFIVETDLIQGAGDGFEVFKAGRFKLAGSGKLLLERKVVCKFSIPESVGFRASTSTDDQRTVELNMRSAKFFHAVYAPATPALLQRIDEEQPATAES